LAGFGAENPPNTFVRTAWNTSDLWMRKKFTLGDQIPGNLTLNIYHDEDAEVYLNGVLIKSLSGYVQDYQEYLLDPEVSQLLYPNSENVLAIHCHQTAGGQYMDAGLFEPGPPVSVKQNGIGLSGQYFNHINFADEALLRLDTVIRFDWGTGSPDLSVRYDSFSIRWLGYIQPSVSGLYTFYINSDNGRKLTIDGQEVIDALVNDWGVEYKGKIYLEGGVRYPIMLEYFDAFGGASVKLDWSCNGVARQTVPSENLWPDYTLQQPVIITGMVNGSNNNQTVGIYPNPANNGFHINYPEQLDHITVCDPAGMIMYSKNVFEKDVYIKINNWSPGIYFVKIHSLGKEVVQKLMVIKRD